MRPSPHSRNIDEQVPIYGPLPTENATSAPSYPAFTTSSNHVDPATHLSAGFSHDIPTLNQHSYTHSGGLHLDPTLSSDPLPHQHQVAPQTTTSSISQMQGPGHLAAQSPPTPLHIPNSAPSGQFDMLPPPNSSHRSWQALHDYAQSHASAHGYALSINTTAKNRSRIKLACVCYGAPKNTHKLTPETRIRKNRISYKTGCRMWVEGKKQEDGFWALRVGEPSHNHPGRAVEGWAVQRKRTWGVQGGRIGVGGVTAKEEKEQMGGADNGHGHLLENGAEPPSQNQSHSLERGGIVWRIVEQEMLRKGGPGQGRDRGVGRTVKVLEERLPGIHIFKRDVYNIRAQIKRARKAAGQQIGEGLNDSDDEDLATLDQVVHSGEGQAEQGDGENDIHGLSRYPEIDPMLVAQCNDALKNVSQQEESEVDGLRREVEELRLALEQRAKELEDKNSENERLRMDLEVANMALYNSRSGLTQ
ncbi:uncharacterized protein BDR25DRAFT_302117 [Lindgomyces ingoldianus]|uniref:Uncharacterized protein n=1 Tax=Lindgomyces ingoldianus TaxID=673940 RepID=A0ACB6R2R1_9PLEO|nr:uncharacterized protein BDR25DRAFT_302117 [Lindgomyces ingoldianus]KAF2473108.1 hypothetical protein BDR25DRAFT_302117 [Lindgomyces ingoldianus]